MATGILDLQECCHGLESTKITEIRRSADTLIQLLDNGRAANILNSNGGNKKGLSWNTIFSNVHKLILKEADKLEENERKKKAPCLVKNNYGDLLRSIVRIANTKETRLDIIVLFSAIRQYYKSNSARTYFSKIYITILKDNILSSRSYWPHIEAHNWIWLIALLKELIEKPVSGLEEIKPLQCLHMLIQWGPLHRLSSTELRQEFLFIFQVASQMNGSSSTLHQTVVLNILYDYCVQTCEDNRMSCCKLGEQLFGNFISLYSKSNDSTKLLILKFLLLQVQIHHPNGSTQGSISAYACCWAEWNKNLKLLYSMLCEQMNKSIQSKFKSTAVFEGQNMLHETFVTLIVQIFKQIFNNSRSDYEATTTTDSDRNEPPHKKKRMIGGIPALTSNIHKDKDWPWINVMTEVLKKCSDLISVADFLELLQVLSTLQTECKNSNIRFHIYQCLTVMVDIETKLRFDLDIPGVDLLWSVVWDSTLRAVGFNENEEQTHTLMQNLILKNKVSNTTQLFRTYGSQVLTVSKYSIQTLNTVCARFHIPDSTSANNSAYLENTRHILIKWVLNGSRNNTAIFSETITAEVLLFLSLKHWPTIHLDRNLHRNKTDFEQIYLLTTFDDENIFKTDTSALQNTDMQSDQHVWCSDTFKYLLDVLLKFSETILLEESKPFTAIKNLLNVTVLLANLLSLMLKFNILQLNELEQDHKLVEMIGLLIKKCSTLILLVVKQTTKKNGNHQMLEVFKQMKYLFRLNVHDKISRLLREQVPSDLLQEIFELLNNEEEAELGKIDFDTYRVGIYHLQANTLSLELMDVLCSFCSVCSPNYLFTVQEQILEAIVTSEFKPELMTEYVTTLAFLNNIGKFSYSTLSNHVLDMALRNIQKIAEISYLHYDSALNILQILNDLYPHIAISKNDEFKENAIRLLHPFYTLHSNYGPNVAIAVVNCMSQIVKYDITVTWATENSDGGNSKILFDMPNFLQHDYQKVRFTAIKNLQMIFGLPCEDYSQMKLIDSLLYVVCEKCTKVFEVEDGLSEERKVDETVTRTATALYALTSVLFSNSILRQKCLSALLQLVYDKKLNMDCAKRVLEMAAKQLTLQDVNTLIANNLNYLVHQWYSKNYPLKDFPYNLLGCTSHVDFFAKYTFLIIPIVITDDVLLVTEICQHYGRPVNEVLEECYPTIVAQYLLVSRIDDSYATEDQVIKKAYNNLGDILTPTRMNELLLEKFDDVIIHIIQQCFDPNDIKSRFQINCILPEPHPPHFNVLDVQRTIEDIETTYLNNKATILYCMEKCPKILQSLLLKVITYVHCANTCEEKIRTFHHYTMLLDLILPWLDGDADLSVYVIRTVTYSLLHLISHNYECDLVVNVVYCRYFSTFISTILPKNANILEKHLITLVSVIIPITRLENSVGVECTKLLNNVIVNHRNDIINGIKMLDPFPAEERFLEMQSVYKTIRYDSETYSLESEINSFLLTGNLMGSSGNRTEGLRHLKNQLSSKKPELKEIYNKLHNLRGFSEDCEKSILHRLIKMLIKLSLSLDQNESLEATRCLGELGPADLLTTILQVEQKYETKKCNTFELVTGNVIALLAQYIVEFNIEVIKLSSKALYYVLDSKEAKIALVSKLDYGNGIIEQAYISPFISARNTKSNTSYDVKSNFAEIVSCNELWYPSSSCTHSEWITRLVCNILKAFKDTSYLKELIPLCKNKVSFAEHLLPLIIYLTLFSKYSTEVSSQIQMFFEMHWTISFQNTSKRDLIVANKESVQCMLNVVHFIRIRKNVESLKNFNNLTLNYLHVAQAAQFCTAHFTSLLYVDLWYQKRIKEIWKTTDKSTLALTGLTPLEIVSQHETVEVQQTLQNILKQGYKKIGEMDGVRSCKTVDLLNSQPYIEHYENLKHYEHVALTYDVQIANGDCSSVPKLLTALKNCGFYELPLKYNGPDQPQFECAWRLNHWNIVNVDTKDTESYDKFHYFALKALHDKDKFNFVTCITKARTCIVNLLRHASLEGSKNLYKPLSQFQSLNELEDFFASINEDNLECLLTKWKYQDEINRNAFEYVEPIRAQRITMLKSVSDPKYNLQNSVVDMHLNLAVLARVESNHYVANRTLRNILYIPDLTLDIKNQVLMEQAQMYWLDDKAAAKYNLRHLFTRSLSPRLQAAALKLYGTWMAETCSENPQTIIRDYFSASLTLLDSLEEQTDDKNICETYDILARFADSQYQQVLSYIKSSVFETKVHNMTKAMQAAKDIKTQASGKLNADESRAIETHQRQSNIDQIEIDNTKKERSIYVELAMRYYILDIQHSDINNVRMFRIFSLWLENRLDPKIRQLVKDNIDKIPTYKYVPLLPQLGPHITCNEEDLFGRQITAIMERCANDHPHHTIPIILALAHSNADRVYSKSTASVTSNEPRVACAEKLIEKFKQSRSFLKAIVVKMEILSKALIELAYVDINTCKKKDKNAYLIPNQCYIMKVKNFENILLPTCSLPISKNCNYKNITGIHSYKPTFAPVGGINIPKQIACVGTDGLVRRQLVKGKDDLRQDAVMQQVFSIMNELLSCNKQTANLIIRTYKVVPLSQRSGVLEWVENSMPLAEYLVGAHEQYNLDDIPPTRCRNLIKNAAKLSHSDKLNIYKDICQKFKPVLHKFFETSFIEPAIWYERRRAYMYSVATSSMCGYILGLGDRHVQNILIDRCTAEVIHIDFGIAFEQGKILATPETVPFRLTRDLEDGMGISGIEGVFRKSCERTLEVLRINSETIISILEVLLYDPLYAWTITPAEAYSHQLNNDLDNSTTNQSVEYSDGENGPVNITAERALLRLKQKLQGTEEGSSSSIEGQVEKLLQQARDPSNLSRLFHGWQAYL